MKGDEHSKEIGLMVPATSAILAFWVAICIPTYTELEGGTAIQCYDRQEASANAPTCHALFPSTH